MAQKWIPVLRRNSFLLKVRSAFSSREPDAASLEIVLCPI
ncbi:hypothetical protein CSIRO_0361 [Bradyrhizobiaceae bacterium SG-6C]|nr:hypothetical protein CSIRO_0361 [Bradyrhizobiaceae bacterium SG-6C]